MKRSYLAIALLLCTAIPASSQNTQHSITLNWTEATTGVTFSVYRGVASGVYTKIATGLNTLTYVDTTGTGGVTYFYVVTAVDSQSDESVYSNEVSATFLSNPTPPMLAAPVRK